MVVVVVGDDHLNIIFSAACSSTITASSVSETIIYLGIPDDDAHAKVVMSFFDLSSSCWRRCWRGTEEETGRRGDR